MRYVDEYRSKGLIQKIADKIKKITPSDRIINIMEVCGTHTQNFYRFGLYKVMPDNLRFSSGPGCPVCVSCQEYIDAAIDLAKNKDVIIATFGDMLRVPGTKSSLERERAESAQVRIVYSALDSLLIARQNPKKKVIFLAVGFETTAPTIALSILLAQKENLKNIFFYSSLKLIPPAMEYLVKDKRLTINGFLCPGHVSTIIGTKPYEFIPKRYKIGCCITGFEPLDILEGVYLLIQQAIKNKPCVKNQYRRVVTVNGNIKAKEAIFRVFKVDDGEWRGLGRIAKSGLRIRDKFFQFDAEKQFTISHKLQALNRQLKKCRCGQVLKGLLSPLDCPLFAQLCKPDHPLGACMVSSEGACAAYYKYRRDA